MSSSSASSAAHSESDEKTVDSALVYQNLCDFFDSTPCISDEALLFEAAAQHLTTTLERVFTGGEVRAHVSNARVKRKRRKQTVNSANHRVRVKEAKIAEYDEKMSTARTRKQREKMEAELGTAPTLSAVTLRSASTLSTHACAMIDSLTRLQSRRAPRRAGRGAEERKEEADSDTTAARSPLADITNQLDQVESAAAASSSHSSSDTDDTQNASSSSAAAIHSDSTQTSSPHSKGLLSAKQRITLKQKKRDLKKELAEATAGEVRSELAAREKTTRMVEEATKLLTELNKSVPAMNVVIEALARKYVESKAAEA